MKKAYVLIFMGLAMLGTSCKKYLDINTNPNDATSATPPLILPQALTATANVLNGYNTYGAQLGGFMANAGGYGGFGVAISYNYTSSNYTNLWSSAYDNLEDYQAILDKSADAPEYSYFAGVATIMKALDFQLLVDAYNDIPYTEALKGADNLTPTYTDAKEVYKSLAEELDKAIDLINTGDNTVGVTALGSSDVVFGGDMTKWKQLANTLKLRLMIHGNGKVTFSNTSFSGDGFLTTDALVDPGYVRDNGKQNPKWNTWGFSYTGSSGSKAWMPTTFVMAFYNGTKLSDAGRGAATYYQYPNTPTNKLGYESTGVTSSPEGSFWYPSTNRVGSNSGDATGTLKGPDAGFPIITAAESYFLQAEAIVRGIMSSGDAQAMFENGITASFTYLYTKPDGTVSGTPAADAAAYIVDNNTSYLADFSKATTEDEKIEAIITQKYIALNMVNSDEAWNEYRRTHYPTLVNSPSASGTETFASTVSESTRPDRLPTRVLYPTSEGSYNSTNVPKNISPFSSLIFWAL